MSFGKNLNLKALSSLVDEPPLKNIGEIDRLLRELVKNIGYSNFDGSPKETFDYLNKKVLRVDPKDLYTAVSSSLFYQLIGHYDEISSYVSSYGDTSYWEQIEKNNFGKNGWGKIVAANSQLKSFEANQVLADIKGCIRRGDPISNEMINKVNHWMASHPKFDFHSRQRVLTHLMLVQGDFPYNTYPKYMDVQTNYLQDFPK